MLRSPVTFLVICDIIPYNKFFDDAAARVVRFLKDGGENPELMAQDYEGFPRQWYNEGFISQEDFDNILEMKFAEYRLNQFNMKQYSDKCDKHGADAVDDFMELYDDLADFEEAYCGEWDSEEDFARHIIDECYNIEKMMGSLANYFDYEAYARELFMYDYTMGANNNVFRRV